MSDATNGKSGFFAMLSEAWRAMGANRLRTFLTMLGMVIGVGAVVLMMAIGQGAQYAIKQTIAGMGSNLFILIAGSTSSSGVIASGEAFTNSDVRSGTRVALIGQTAAQNLFGDENPVGKTFRIRQSPFVVLGTLALKGQGMDGRDQDDSIIIPLTTAQRQVFGSQFPGSVRMMMVQTTSQEVMPEVEKSMIALLRQRHRLREGMDNDFFLRNLTAAADSAEESTRVMSLLLGAIASVSLLVGGIGIMNIMLVSVTERTREIGIRMAIGARERDILQQFLLEAIIISVVGCFIGLLLGIGAALLTDTLTGTAVIISGSSVLVAFSVAAAVGIFFGFYPARKAARLDPIEALRYQ
jgi:putative ABC transport system permease protein